MNKVFICLILLMAVGFATVTITPNEGIYNCTFGVCEEIEIQIQRVGLPLNETVYFVAWTTGTGYIESIEGFTKRGNKEFELSNPFELESNNEYKLNFIALGIGQVHLNLTGSESQTVYASLNSPGWIDNYGNRININITNSNGLRENAVFNITIDTQGITTTGSDIALTYYNTTADNQTVLYIWNENNVSGWNTATTRILTTSTLENGTNQFYLFANNTTAVTNYQDINQAVINGDVFLGDGLNQTKWLNHSSGITVTADSVTLTGNSVYTNMNTRVEQNMTNKTMVAYVKFTGAKNKYIGMVKHNTTAGNNYYFNPYSLIFVDTDFTVSKTRTDDTGGSPTTGATFTLTANYNLLTQKWNDTAIQFFSNGTSLGVATADIPTTSLMDTYFSSDNADASTVEIDYTYIKDTFDIPLTLVIGLAEESPDATPPTLNFTTPGADNSSLFSANNITWDIDLNDETELGNFTMSVTYTTAPYTVEETNTTDLTGETTFNIGHITDTSTWADGVYNLTIILYDLEGNSYNETITFEINDDAPVVELLTPINNYYAQYNESGIGYYLLNFSYNVTDNHNISFCELEINGSYVSNDTSITKDTTQWFEDINISSLTNNTYNVHCAEEHGAEGEQGSYWYFYINTTNHTIMPGSVCPEANASEDMFIYSTKSTGSCCLDDNTVRYYWTIGAYNYTKDEFISSGCYNVTVNGAIQGVGNYNEGWKWLVFFGVFMLIAGGYVLKKG